MDTKQIARAILRAQEIREKSWVNEGTCGYYKVQEIDAANEACLAEGIQPVAMLVYYLNRGYWNDVQDWSNKVLELWYDTTEA